MFIKFQLNQCHLMLNCRDLNKNPKCVVALQKYLANILLYIQLFLLLFNNVIEGNFVLSSTFLIENNVNDGCRKEFNAFDGFKIKKVRKAVRNILLKLWMIVWEEFVHRPDVDLFKVFRVRDEVVHYWVCVSKIELLIYHFHLKRLDLHLIILMKIAINLNQLIVSKIINTDLIMSLNYRKQYFILKIDCRCRNLLYLFFEIFWS